MEEESSDDKVLIKVGVGERVGLGERQDKGGDRVSGSETEIVLFCPQLARVSGLLMPSHIALRELNAASFSHEPSARLFRSFTLNASAWL